MDGRLISRVIAPCSALFLFALTGCDDSTPSDTSRDAAPIEGAERDGEVADASDEPEDDADVGSEHDGGVDDLDGAPEDDADTGNELDAGADTGDAVAETDGETEGDADPDADGAAPCTPACADKTCGDDGCGGSCGTCSEPQQCNVSTGACVASCQPSCGGKQCGDDGCGGSCGSCEDGETCTTAAQCACTPDCVGRACGDDGCGGSCGDCSGEQTCDDSGQCVSRAPSFADDVYPIFVAAGCPDCHDASGPSAGLDLSSAAVARTNLVGGPSGQCSPARALVAAGSPDASYLINKLTGVGLCSGQRMPRGGRPPLSNAQIDVVRTWIESGAAP